MQKAKTIYTLFVVQVLFMIYAALFITQAFSINDTEANKGTTMFLTAVKEKKCTGIKSHQRKHCPGRPRLNKRFQPESWLILEPAPIAYNRYIPPVNKPLYFYQNGFVPSFLFIAQTLRGPPAIA